MNKHRITFYFLVLILILSCSSGSREADLAYTAAEAPRAMMKSEAASMEPEPLMVSNEDSLSDSTVPSETADEDPGRKRIYNGSIGLIVDKPEDSRKALEKLTLSTGGYVESSYSDYMILRIPAALFRTTFKEILGMGKVSHQEISTWDVTEQFADSQQRLTTAMQTRERLYALLNKSSDAEERARILREIGRLSEEIESIRQQLSMMENRIAYSRISVSLEARLDEGYGRYDIPFDWIASLDPLYPVSDRLKASVKLNPGDNFAVFEKEKSYIAEDAEGTTLFISSVDNEPRGDASFWQKALEFHLSEYYESAEDVSINIGDKEFKGIHFISKDREPYQFIVAVFADGKTLHILEIFTPGGNKDLSSLMKDLEEGEIR
ncbi:MULTISPECIES: DUF4349 domain-containing protein [unclassified Oceanispirochaeta]|uniref:DUF4349 domain-containing protein n=1 Tax=unclassified Oceanispirochaeta TaxID=2635722 RepID=UPI000E09C452|nr:MULTISPECIES: DUF4349 domain-containing protein [unclassified Oceanispirochaeta]MBF9016210.1 DUF4349 domain-containing protein [Oceanispirochaeta sp. M2]NPD72672.1 DUF4349 domain-containing protein [Oceanispirochaeta sp. M1]RDG31822.1 DUF4349 domain-containing protein [Oceanispirochaeta sp. M1]